jgi:hypothetical protein
VARRIESHHTSRQWRSPAGKKRRTPKTRATVESIIADVAVSKLNEDIPAQLAPISVGPGRSGTASMSVCEKSSP